MGTDSIPSLHVSEPGRSTLDPLVQSLLADWEAALVESNAEERAVHRVDLEDRLLKMQRIEGDRGQCIATQWEQARARVMEQLLRRLDGLVPGLAKIAERAIHAEWRVWDHVDPGCSLDDPAFSASVRDSVRERLDGVRAYALVAQDAIHDGLLRRILNRRHLDVRLEEELDRLARSSGMDTPLSVAILDLDHFKRVNDTHGHPAGDQVLLVLQDLLLTHVRRYDVVGRYGGEEIMIVMPGISEEQAIARMENVRCAIEVHPFTVPSNGCSDSRSISVTASVGVRTVLARDLVPTESYDEGSSAHRSNVFRSRRKIVTRRLIEGADQALYHAKEVASPRESGVTASRNRVVGFSEVA